MPTSTNSKTFPVDDFSGANQRKTTKFLRKVNQIELSVNGDFSRIGGISKIKGYDNLGSAIGATAILGMGQYNNSDGTEKFVAVMGTDAYIYTVAGGSWTAQSQSLTTSLQAEMVTFVDYLFLVNGTDANRSYSGSAWSTATNVADSPIAKHIEREGVNLYLGNITIGGVAYSSRVWKSDLPKADGSITWGLETGTDLVQTAASAVVTSAGSVFKTRNIKVGDPFTITTGTNAGEYVVQSIDSETQITLTAVLTYTQASKTFWVGGNYFDVGTDDGDTLKGFSQNSSEVLIFKRDSLHRYSSRGNELRQVKSAKGTTSTRSIVNVGDYTYYYHPTGIMRYGAGTSLAISNAVYDLIEGVTDANQTEVSAWVENDEVIVFYLGDVTLRNGETITKCAVAYNTGMNTWEPRSYDIAIERSANWLVSDVPKVYIGTDAGAIHQINTGNDFNGSAIAWQVEDQPRFPAGDDTTITFEKIRLYVKEPLNIQVMFKLIYKPTNDPKRWINDRDWRPMVGTTDAEKVEFSFPLEDNKASGVIFQFIESSTSETFLLEKYVIYFSDPTLR